jgi:integrase
MKERVEPGIYRVHRTACPRRRDKTARCAGTCAYQAAVNDKRAGKPKWSPTFPSKDSARAWRQDTQRAIRRGELAIGQAPTLREAADQFIAGMESGEVNSNRRRPYMASTAYDYRKALENDVLPELGAKRLDQITPADIRKLIGRVQRRGLSGTRVHNIVSPLRDIFRMAFQDGLIAVNPMAQIAKALPDRNLTSARSRPTRVVAPEQIEQLLAPLTTGDRVIWGLPFYAGLRLGEIRGLRWCDVDYAAGMLRVSQAFSERAWKMGDPKYDSGREMPLIPALRELLMEHYLASGQPAAEALVTPGARGGVVTYKAIYQRRAKAWAGLKGMPEPPLRLHEARHTYQTVGHAAGLTLKESTTYMSHKSSALNIDRYTHLPPGSHEQAAAKLQAFLDAATGVAAAAVEPDAAAELLAEMRQARRLLERLLGADLPHDPAA